MIDHDGFRMCGPYNRGERNVFTRKLYTPAGQQASTNPRALSQRP